MKIFRILNFVHIAATVVLFSYTFYYNPIPYTDTPAFMAVVLIPLLIVVNCISNIKLIQKHSHKESMSLGGKIFFWLLYTLFIALTALLVFAAYKSYISYTEYAEKGFTISFPFKVRNIFLFSEVLNGIYISFYQFYFFFLVKRNSKSRLESLVNEIGEPEKFKP